MSALFKLGVYALVGMFLLVPLGLLLLVVGVPALVVFGVALLPIVAVLALAGLPFLLLFVLGAVVVGLLGAVFGLLFMLLKLALFVVLPVLAIVWVAKQIAGSRNSAARAEYAEW